MLKKKAAQRLRRGERGMVRIEKISYVKIMFCVDKFHAKPTYGQRRVGRVYVCRHMKWLCDGSASRFLFKSIAPLLQLLLLFWKTRSNYFRLPYDVTLVPLRKPKCHSLVHIHFTSWLQQNFRANDKKSCDCDCDYGATVFKAEKFVRKYEI